MSDVRDDFLQISKDLSTIERMASRAVTPEEQAYYDMLRQEAMARFIIYRRDIGGLFLFMLRAASHEFPVDIKSAVSGAIDDAMMGNIETQVTRLYKENNALRMRVESAEKRIEELMVIWNTTFLDK